MAEARETLVPHTEDSDEEDPFFRGLGPPIISSLHLPTDDIPRWPSGSESLVAAGPAVPVDWSYASAASASLFSESVGLISARAAEDARYVQSTPADEQKRILEEKKKFEEQSKQEPSIRAKFPTATRNVWQEHSAFRGLRTDVPPSGYTDGMAYELALKALASTTQLEGRDLAVVNARATHLIHSPGSALWSNEMASLAMAIQQTNSLGHGRPAAKARNPQATPVAVVTPPPGAFGMRRGDLLFFGDHWWTRTKDSRWSLSDPPATYGTDPILAMRNYLYHLYERWKQADPKGIVDFDGEWLLGDDEHKRAGIFVVIRDGVMTPKNNEIRRVFGMEELDPRDYSEAEVDRIKTALADRNDVATGKVERKKKGDNKVQDADELLVGERSTMGPSKTLGDMRVDVIWSGVDWQPMESRLRKALGYVHPLTDILLRSGEER